MITIEKDEKRVDWNQIRAEYIGGGTSYRKLVEKYGVSFMALKTRAKKEEWTKLRDEAQHKAITKSTQKLVNAMTDNATIAEEIKHKLLLRLKTIESKYPLDATEVRTKMGNSIAIFRIRDLTAAYKDLTDDMPKSGGADIEDLSPLVELLQ